MKEFNMGKPVIGDYLVIMEQDTCPGKGCRKEKGLRLKQIKYVFVCECGCTSKLTLD